MGQHRGSARRLDPAHIAAAAHLSVRDFGWVHALSPRVVRGLLADGLPHLRYPGKITIPREAGARWLEERFRSDRVARVVDEVLADFRPLAAASKRLRGFDPSSPHGYGRSARLTRN
jgi:hypothetical protein